ncbi:MAG TPA: HAD family phosphatase [Sediminibacterium sp.]|nr:HAD family phosphatase [Sediminibacterium sp.]
MNDTAALGIAFDLDGTLIDNNGYHILAWQEFYRKRNRTLTEEEYRRNFNGRTNADVVKYVFDDPGLSAAEIAAYTAEKESLYRELYAPHIKPVPGLIELLQELQDNKIPMVIATSGIVPNIAFMFQHLPIQQYFQEVIHSGHIQKGKPDPEIYQLAARKLGLPPGKCIAFEDATVGIRSAKGAGMKVIALTTTQSTAELADADGIITDYRSVRMVNLLQLVAASA